MDESPVWIRRIDALLGCDAVSLTRGINVGPPAAVAARLRPRSWRRAIGTAVLLVAGLLSVPTIGGCSAGSEAVVEAPTLAVRTAAVTAAPLPTEIPREDTESEGATAAQLAILPFDPAADTYAVTSTVQDVSFPEGVEARPGPWSGDGGHVVAFAVVDGGSPQEPLVRVWTVDAETGDAEWDSGDLQDTLDRAAGLAGWRTDAALALPRADGMLVAPDGAASIDVLGITGQPRELAVSPDGYTVFANGADGAWLIDAGGASHAVGGRPGAGFDSWSWSPDGTMIGLARANGDYYLIDVPSAEAERIAKAPPTGLDGRMPSPRWLSNGRLLLSQATIARTPTGPILDHRIVNPEGGRSDSLPALLGLPSNVTMPADASSWVSPDGAWLVYPVTESDPGAPGTAPRYVHTRSLLVDVSGGVMRDLPAVVDPVWSPDSRRIAFKANGSLAVFDRVDGGARMLAQPQDGVVDYAWSPDGLWLLYTDGGDALWIVAANAQAGPSMVADAVHWDPGPSWAPSGSRFAATVLEPDEGYRLAIFTIALEG